MNAPPTTNVFFSCAPPAQVWVDRQVISLLESSTPDLVRQKLAFHASRRGQAEAEKEFVWHGLTRSGIGGDERARAEREFVEHENTLARHAVELRKCGICRAGGPPVCRSYLPSL